MAESAADIAPIFHWPAWWGALGVMGLALLLGAAVLPRGNPLGWPDRWLVRVAVGLVPVWVGVLAVGQIPGLVTLFPWWLGSVGGWAVFVYSVLRHSRCRSIQPSAPEPAPTFRQRTYRLIRGAGWAALGAWFLLLLGPAGSPPSNYDVLEYHLGLIPHVFQTGLIRPIPHIFYTAQPLGTEMLYTLAATFEGTPWGHGPGLLHWLLLGLGALLAGRAMKRFAVPSMFRPYLLLILLTHPLIFRLEAECMSDWMGLLLLAAGLLAARTPSIQKQWAARAALLGLLAGGAISAKWTHAATVALPLGLFALEGGWRAAGPNPRTKLSLAGAAGALCLGTALLAWLPWGIWLAVMRGNPTAPFLAGWFPTEAWGPERLEFLIASHGGMLSPTSPEYWTNLSRRLFQLAARLSLPGAAHPNAGMLVLGAATLAVTALVPWTRQARSRRRILLPQLVLLILAIGAGVLLWGRLGHAAVRFLAPTMLLLVIASGIALGTLPSLMPRATRSVKWVAGRLAVAVGLGVLAVTAYAPGMRAMRLYMDASLGRISPFEQRQRMLGWTAELFEAANRLPEDARLIAVAEARRYPFRRAITLSTVFDRSPFEPFLRNASEPGQIRRRLVEAGYTHLLVNEFEQLRLLMMHPPRWLMDDPAFLADRAELSPSELIDRYVGTAEFALRRPVAPSLEAYRRFLNGMKQNALWRTSSRIPGGPAMWIAPLAPTAPALQATPEF